MRVAFDVICQVKCDVNEGWGHRVGVRRFWILGRMFGAYAVERWRAERILSNEAAQHVELYAMATAAIIASEGPSDSQVLDEGSCW
jgi:hypothetical protein